MIGHNNLILLFIFLIESVFSCSCRFVTNLDSYESYKQIKNAFVCKITKREVINNIEFLDADVVRSFKGQHEKTIKIKNISFSAQAVGCKKSFNTGQILLLLSGKYSGIYHINACDFSESDQYEGFQNDTLFFNQFSNPNGYIDLSIAKGQLKNGKQEGLWTLNSRSIRNCTISETGYYKKGNKDGIWKTYYYSNIANYMIDSSNYFNNSLEEKNDDFLWPNLYYKRNFIIDSLYYSKGKLTGPAYYFFPNGSLQIISNYKNGKTEGETVEYTKKGFIKSKTFYKSNKTKQYIEFRDSCIFKKNKKSFKTLMAIYSKDGSYKEKEITVLNGKGTFFEYYNNGKIKTKASFNKKGSLIGDFTTFDSSGKTIFIRPLEEDTRLIGDELWNYFPDYEDRH